MSLKSGTQLGPCWSELCCLIEGNEMPSNRINRKTHIVVKSLYVASIFLLTPASTQPPIKPATGYAEIVSSWASAPKQVSKLAGCASDVADRSCLVANGLGVALSARR